MLPRWLKHWPLFSSPAKPQSIIFHDFSAEPDFGYAGFDFAQPTQPTNPHPERSRRERSLLTIFGAPVTLPWSGEAPIEP